MSIRTEYRCTACNGGTFIIPDGPEKLVHSCPYCGNCDSLAINAVVGVPCDITTEADDTPESLTPEQEEMAIYERTVELMGMGKVIRLAMHSLSHLIAGLLEIEAVIASPDCTGKAYAYRLAKLNDRRGAVVVSMNLLEVIFGDCIEAECQHIDELKEIADEAESELAAAQTEEKLVAHPEEPTT